MPSFDVPSRGSGMHPHIQKLIIFGLATFFIISWSSFMIPTSGSSSLHPGKTDIDDKNPIHNTTLGHEKIFVLALPDRSDRVVPLLNAANATNITLTVLDAVRDHEIEHESWPQDWGKDQEHQPGELGCLVSHVRTWKKVIAERLSTAMVIESDGDWDMRVKDIMTTVADGSRAVADFPFTPSNNTERFGSPMDPSPYGENWDIIWHGHCGGHNWGDGRIWRANDTTTPPEDHEFKFGGAPDDEQHLPGTRMTFYLTYGVCSTSYSISYAGAVKLVDYFKESQENLDLRLGTLCREKVDIICVGVYPQVITAAPTHSNIDHVEGEIAAWEDSEEVIVRAGPAIQYSARINAAAVQKGLGRESWQAEWNSTWAMVDDEWKHVSFEELEQLEELARMEGEKDGMNQTSTGRRG